MDFIWFDFLLVLLCCVDCVGVWYISLEIEVEVLKEEKWEVGDGVIVVGNWIFCFRKGL